MANNLRIDYLPRHKKYKVVQHDNMYHFNTDTVLLGNFIKINKGDKVLDVGTNNGVLLVYIYLKGGNPTGLEINKEAIAVAKETLKINKMTASLICDSFVNYKAKEKYDVIISNPPYFTSTDIKEKNDNQNISLARHEDDLNLSSLISGIKRNLKEDGRAMIVYRYDKKELLEKEIKENGFFINRRKIVSNIKKRITILIEFSNNKTRIINTYKKIR